MQLLYAVIWAVIFGFVGAYLVELNSVILNLLGYAALLMCGLSVVTFFKMLGR